MKTKHILALSLTLALLLACFAAALSIGAEQTGSKYDEYLVTYYNFEGETAAEQLADKATAGNSVDTLTATSGVRITNGVAYVPTTQGEYMVADKSYTDIKNVVGKTIYIEFKIDGASSTNNATDMFTTNNQGIRYQFAVPTNAEIYQFTGQVNAGTSNSDKTSNKLKFNASTPTAPVGSGWYYAALTLEATETGLIATTYNSVDGTTYVSEVTECTGGNTLYRTGQLVLGKGNTVNADDRGLSFYFNQFRIYNKVMTADEVAELSTITPSEAVNTPTTEAPTTEAPTTEAPNRPAFPVQKAGLYDENLVAYYNFAGATADEQFADKAPSGSSNDYMTYTENITVTDGVAYIPSTSGEYLAIEMLTGDTADLNGKTYYLEFKSTGTASTDPDLFGANRTFRYRIKTGSTNDNYTFNGGIGRTPTVTGYKLIENHKIPKAPADEWYYVAVTFELTDDALKIITYNSADGSSYVQTVNTFVGEYKLATLLRERPILIGKATVDVEDRGLSYYINEFRIYDKIMTPEEISNLSYITPGQPTTLPERPATTEAPTTTAPTVTTAKPTATTAPQNATAAPSTTTQAPATTETPAEKKGCGAIVAIPIGGIVLAAGIGMLLVRRKED